MVNRSWLIYVSHFLSAWGDRMWRFAVALFLMDLDSNTLLLPAIYGLTLAGSVLTLGPVIGTIIDKSKRLPAAQVPVIIQNLAIAACAAVLLLHKLDLVHGDWFLLFVKIMSVFLGTVAHLASTASTIVIEKDWIVVIAGDDQERLSTLNSTLRRIDLFTKLLAPMVCGQLITMVSLTFGCAFVAGWNIISMFIEYITLQIVYNNTPALAIKNEMSDNPPSYSSTQGNEKDVSSDENCDEYDDNTSAEDQPLLASPGATYTNKTYGSPRKENTSFISTEECSEATDMSDEKPVVASTPGDLSEETCCKTAFRFILIIPKGWKLFMSQSVSLSGIGLACLYMTVVGFDSITVSYAYNQCFSEFFVGILMGASAITGIISTFAFVPAAKKFGLVRTGQFSSVAHVLALAPCVYSVFAPGSPFFMLPSNKNYSPSTTSASVYSFSTFEEINSAGSNSSLLFKCMEGVSPPSSYLSLSMLMGGAVLARIGLWAFDLTVTQLFQEEVAENERGVVNGVQSSINNLMDMIHFVLVIVFPSPDQFGLLVLISALFVCIGHFLYAIFARKIAGYFCLCRC